MADLSPEIFYIGKPTNQNAEKEVTSSDVITHVTNRSELNVILKSCRGAQSVVLESDETKASASQQLTHLINMDDMNPNGLNYSKNGLSANVTELCHIKCDNVEESNSSEILKVMESKRTEVESCLNSGSKVSHLTTYLNGSNSYSKINEYSPKGTRKIKVFSMKSRIETNENSVGSSSPKCGMSKTDLLDNTDLEVKSNDDGLKMHNCDTLDTVEITSDFNTDILPFASAPLHENSTTNRKHESLKGRNGSIKEGQWGCNGLNTIDGHLLKVRDIAPSTSHQSTGFNPTAFSNYFQVPTYNECPVKQISWLTDMQEVNVSMAGKPEKLNSTPEPIFALNLADEDLKCGKKINSSIAAEKYNDEFRNRKVSSVPDKSLEKVVEEHHDHADVEITKNDDSIPVIDSDHLIQDDAQVIPASDDCILDLTDDTGTTDKSYSGLVVFDAFFATQEAFNKSNDQPAIEIVIEDVDAQSDETNSSVSDSEVDFELRAQLLAQINPLLLAPGFSDHHGYDVNSDSDDTASNSTGSTIICTSQRNHLERVKGLTERLNLNTKRPSFVAWKEQIIDKPYLWRHRVAHQVVNKGIKDDWSSERLSRVTEALAWLRSELMDMRVQDQVIAQQLVALRKEIHRFKLEKLTAEHQDMIEDACEMESEKRDELAEIDDAPPDMFSPTLKHFGLTPMNISTRRFSVF